MNKQNILRDFYKMRQNGHCERLIVSEELRKALEKSGKSVREYFETDGEWIFGTIIYPRHRDAFFYTLATGERRFIEGTCFYDISDEVLLDVATEFINDYANQVVVDRDICDVFEGNLTEAE